MAFVLKLFSNSRLPGICAPYKAVYEPAEAHSSSLVLLSLFTPLQLPDLPFVVLTDQAMESFH